MHYEDGEGSWREVDLGLRSDGGGRFNNRARNEFGLSVASDQRDRALVRLESDGVEVAFSLEGARPGSSSPDSDGQTITYRGVLAAADLRLTSTGSGVKEELVLHSPEAGSRFVFPLAVSGGSLRLDADDGAIVVVDDDGQEVFRIPSGWMHDSSGDVQAGTPEATSTGVGYALIESDGRQALEVTLDGTWLDDPKRVYPVVVDPTVLHTQHEPYFYLDTHYYEGNTTSAYTGSSYLRTGRAGSSRYKAFLQFGSDGPPGAITPGDGEHAIQDAYFRAYNTYASSSTCERFAYAKHTHREWHYPSWKPDYWAEYFGPPYDDTSGGPADIDNCAGSWVRFDVTDIVRKWEADERANYGIALLGSHTFTDSYRVFYSQNYSNSSYHPYMDIDWYNTTPAVPTSPSPTGGKVFNSKPSELYAYWSGDADGDGGYGRFQLRYAGTTAYLVGSHGSARSNGARGKINGWDSDWYGDLTYSLSGVSVGTGLYEWRVVADDHHDLSAWTSWQTFEVNGAPDVPDLAYPVDGEDYAPPPSYLRAVHRDDQGDAGDVKFWLYRKGSDGYWDIVESGWDYDVTSGSSAYLYPSSTLNNGEYRWRARTRDEHDKYSPYSGYDYFTVHDAPDVPTLESPADGFADPAPPAQFTAGYSDGDGDDGQVYFQIRDSAGNVADAGWSTTVSSGSTASFEPSATLGADEYTWRARARDDRGAYSSFSAYRSFVVDGTGPSAPEVSSSSHPDPDAWYADTSVDLSWSAQDADSGIDGYSHVFDGQSGTTPDETSQGTATSGTETAEGSGTFYFHVRAVNGTGIWGPTSHLQVNVDVDAPSQPGAVASTSHPAGVGSSERDVTVNWTAGDDDHSGVAGYSWKFSQASDDVVDANADGDADTRQTTETLDDGDPDTTTETWWFHVATVDDAGNASPTQTYGPIVIDESSSPLPLSPTIGSDTHATSDEFGVEGWFPLGGFDVGVGQGFAHLRTGNTVVRYDDVTVPAQGLNVVVGHAYNSGRADAGLLAAYGLDESGSGLGRGWNLSVTDVDAGLEGATSGVDVGWPIVAKTFGSLDDSGVFVVDGKVVEFVDGDGTTHRFVRHGPAGARWQAPPGLDLRLVEHDDDGDGIAETYELHRTDGVVYRAERVDALVADPTGLASPTWRVTEVTDRNANRLAYDYRVVDTAAGPAVRITSVAHNGVDGDATTDDVLVDFAWNDDDTDQVADGSLEQIVALAGHQAADPGDPAGASRPWERVNRFVVDADSGQLQSWTANTQATDVAAGRRAVDYAYGTDERLASITGARANATAASTRSTDLTFDGDGVLQAVNDREGHDATYTYSDVDADGDGATDERQTTRTSPARDTTTYTISARGPVSVDDPRVAGGNILRIEDDGAASGPDAPVVAVVDTFDWDANLLTASTDGAGQTTGQDYDAYGHLTGVDTPPTNDPDATGLPADAATGRVASTLAWRYSRPLGYDDCTGLPATSTDPAQADCYAVADLVATVAADSHDDVQRATDYTVDDAGNLTAVAQRGSDGDVDRVLDLDYYTHGGLKSVDGPRTDVDDVTVYGDTTDADYGGYHRTGQPTSVTDAAGNTLTVAYTPYGQPARHTDRDGHTTYRRHDERGLTVAEVDPRGEATGDHARYTTSHTYNGDDTQTTSETPGGLTTTRTHDWMERPTTLTEAGVTVEQTVYHPDGTVASTTNAVGGTTSYDYWPNRLAKRVVAPADDGEQAVTDTFYDAAARQVRVDRPAANDAGQRPVTTTAYTPAGQVAVTESTSTTDTPARVEQAYNAHGEVVQARGPRQVDGMDEEVRYGYDAFGQQILMRRLLNRNALDEPRWLDTIHDYDAAGNLTAVTQPYGKSGSGDDLTTNYTYDVLNRVASKDDPDSPDLQTTFAWTPDGKQQARTETDTSTGSALRSTRLVYNVDGTVAQEIRVDHQDGDVLAGCADYNVDALPTEITLDRHAEGAGDYCDLAGERLHRQTFGYDARNRMNATTQQVTSPSGAVVSREQTFTYRADGTLEAATHDGHSIDFGYPDSGASGGRWNDRVGDWRGHTSTMDLTASGQPTRINLADDASATIARHADGSVASAAWTRHSDSSVVREHTDVTYDAGGMLTSAQVQVLMPDGDVKSGEAAFTYDVPGRLISRTSPYPYSTLDSGQVTTRYQVAEGGNVLQEVRDTDSSRKRHTMHNYGPGNRLWWRDVEIYGEGLEIDTEIEAIYHYNAVGDETSRDVTATTAISTTSHELVRAYSPAGHVSSVARVPEGSTFTGTDDQLEPPEGGWQVLYGYDLSERLITRHAGGDQADDPGEHLYFYWGTSGVLAEETDGQGTTRRRYLVDAQMRLLGHQTWDTAADGNVDTSAGDKWVWTIPDEHGNTATLLEGDGTVVEQKAFGAYGQPDESGSQRKQPDLTGSDWDPESILGFQSVPADKTSGNVLLGPRQYDPHSLRFTNSDTYTSSALDLQLGTDPLTGNRYVFAAANPVAYYEDGHRLAHDSCEPYCTHQQKQDNAWWNNRAVPSGAITAFKRGGGPQSGGPASRAVAFGYAFERMGIEPPRAPFGDAIAIALGHWSGRLEWAAGMSGALSGPLALHPATAPAVPALKGTAIGALVTATLFSAGEAAVGAAVGSGPRFRETHVRAGLFRFGRQMTAAATFAGLHGSGALVEQTGGRVPRWYRFMLDMTEGLSGVR